MRRTATIAVLTLASGTIVLALLPAGGALSQEIQHVLVTNFPRTQQVSGTVSVEGPVRHASLQRVKEILVPPVGPMETTRLIDGGTVTTDGFTGVVLSLHGQARGKTLRGGTVGAILLPEEEPIQEAFEEEGLVQFPLEVSAALEPGGARSFASSQQRLAVGFPRYRVRLYNTSDRTVTVSLYAYLTN
jgi:hypothetical protein